MISFSIGTHYSLLIMMIINYMVWIFTISAFEKFFYDKMARMEEKQDILMKMISALGGTSHGATISKALDHLPKPLTTKEEVDLLETTVAADPTIRNIMVSMHIVTHFAIPIHATLYSTRTNHSSITPAKITQNLH